MLTYDINGKRIEIDEELAENNVKASLLTDKYTIGYLSNYKHPTIANTERAVKSVVYTRLYISDLEKSTGTGYHLPGSTFRLHSISSSYNNMNALERLAYSIYLKNNKLGAMISWRDKGVLKSALFRKKKVW